MGRKKKIQETPQPEVLVNMNFADVKAVYIHCKQWYDRANGNSYFAARCTVEDKVGQILNIHLPFQYGYGEHYKDVFMRELAKRVAGVPDIVFWKLRNYGISTGTRVENAPEKEVKTW